MNDGICCHYECGSTGRLALAVSQVYFLNYNRQQLQTLRLHPFPHKWIELQQKLACVGTAQKSLSLDLQVLAFVTTSADCVERIDKLVSGVEVVCKKYQGHRRR